MDPDTENFLRRAAQPTADAIARRECEASGSVRVILAEMRRHFCEPGYTVNALRQSSNVSRYAMTVFRREVGLTPWRFIQHCRMQTAARLLRDTAFSVADIAFFVGYYDLPAFDRAFRRWCGLTPASYRVLARKLRDLFPELAEEMFPWSFWGQCLTGEARADRLHKLVEYLQALRSLWP